MKTRMYLMMAVALTPFFLEACGGGSGVSSQPPPTEPDTSSLLKGVVVDGYLVGAKVCLDLNTNWVCDSGEPAAISGAGGQFSLNVAPLKYWDTYDKLVIAEVGEDAKDEAAGKTLKELGSQPYTLASVGGPLSVLSPMKTLQVAQYFNNGMKDLAEATKVTVLLTESGMSATEEDYFDQQAKLTNTERDLAKRSARVLAKALGRAQARLKSEVQAVYGANASGLGGRSASLLMQALADTRPSSSSESEADQQTRIDQQLASLAVHVDTEKLLQRTARVLTQAEMLAVWGDGLYDPALLASTPRNAVVHSASGDGGALSAKSWQYRNNVWTLDTTYQSQGVAGYRVLYRDYTKIVGSNVASASISIDAPIVLKDGSTGLKEKFSGDANSPSRQVQLLERDAQGLNFSGVSALASFNGSFSTGHKLYQLRRKTLAEEYVFDGVASFFTSLAAFKASPRTCYAGVCWSITQQANGNTVAGTMRFTTTSSAGSLDLGEGQFIEEEIAGVYLLRMTRIPIGVQNRSSLWSAKEGRYPIFADFGGKLWTGRFAPTGTVWMSDWLLPKDSVNAVLTLVPLTAITP